MHNHGTFHRSIWTLLMPPFQIIISFDLPSYWEHHLMHRKSAQAITTGSYRTVRPKRPWEITGPYGLQMVHMTLWHFPRIPRTFVGDHCYQWGLSVLIFISSRATTKHVFKQLVHQNQLCNSHISLEISDDKMVGGICKEWLAKIKIWWQHFNEGGRKK